MKKDYKKCVMEQYPEAMCIGVGATIAKSDTGLISYMIIGCKLGENYSKTKELAWENAYNKLKQKESV